jgi:sulfite exporter TauE/SafE
VSAVTALTLSVLAASLLGSLHCAGMCGGLVAFYAGDPADRRRAGAPLAHLAYNVGRLAVYAALGAAAGALGAALDLGGTLLGVQRVAAVVAGALIALWGAMTLLELSGRRVPRFEPPPGLRRLVSHGVGLVAARRPPVRALVVGLLTGCLPCGWLYAFVATAAGTGSAASGALVMVVFWLGTLPVMVGLGLGLRALAGPLARHVPAACAVAMIVLGLLAVAGRVTDAPHTLVDLHHAASHGPR